MRLGIQRPNPLHHEDLNRPGHRISEIHCERGSKGQIISKENCQAMNSSKKQTNGFVFTSMQRVFVRFLEESSARKKRYQII